MRLHVVERSGNNAYSSRLGANAVVDLGVVVEQYRAVREPSVVTIDALENQIAQSSGTS